LANWQISFLQHQIPKNIKMLARENSTIVIGLKKTFQEIKLKQCTQNILIAKKSTRNFYKKYITVISIN